MSREFSRTDRVADALQKALAVIIQNELRDPRIGMVSVNAVEVSRDLAHAKVFVTFVDNPKNCPPDERVAILNKVSGFLRSALGQDIQMRTIPQLRFVFDETIYKAQEISDLISKARKSDEDKRKKSDEDF
jgi:ribosome-binding factor A